MAEVPFCMAGVRFPPATNPGYSVLTRRPLAAMVAAVADSTTKDYSLAELSKLTGYSDRTIRRYVDLGLVPAPKRDGRMARFTREHLGRFWAIACRRREDRWGSPDVRDELQEMTLEEALEWADKRDPLAPSAAPLASSPLASTSVSPQPTAAATIATPAEPTPGAPGAALAEPLRWGRIPLLPGMDLVVREGASEIVVRLAREIVAKYGAG